MYIFTHTYGTIIGTQNARENKQCSCLHDACLYSSGDRNIVSLIQHYFFLSLTEPWHPSQHLLQIVTTNQ